MQCNWQKTKLQNIGSGTPPLHAQDDGCVTLDLRKRIRLASNVMGQLDAVWRHSRFSFSPSFICIFLYSIVLSAVLVGSMNTEAR